MRLIRNPELKGILVILLIALILGIVLAGTSGRLEQWGIPWFTGAKVVDKIIFVSERSGTSEIYAMDLDGSNQKQLTRGANVLSAPAISPTGNRVLFVGVQGSITQVFAVGVGGGKHYPITASSNPKRQPEFSPDGKRISYIEAGRVFVADLNGSNPDSVLPGEEEMAAAMSDPMARGALPVYTAYAWGPDSSSMAAIVRQNQFTDALVYLQALHDESHRFAAPGPIIRVTGVAWAADTPIMASSIQVGKDEAMVVVFDADEKQSRPVFAANKVTVGAPAVSPDGSIVVAPVDATMSKRPSGLLKVDVQTGESAILCKGLFEEPVFSPGGDSILATQLATNTKKRSVVTIDIESGEVTKLAARGNCFKAVWSPQSQ